MTVYVLRYETWHSDYRGTYSDDFVVVYETKAAAQAALDKARKLDDFHGGDILTRKVKS